MLDFEIQYQEYIYKTLQYFLAFKTREKQHLVL